jgi:hypothetical protein
VKGKFVLNIVAVKKQKLAKPVEFMHYGLHPIQFAQLQMSHSFFYFTFFYSSLKAVERR